MKTQGTTELPPDLAEALGAEPGLLGMWRRFRPSCQREYIASVLDAKRPETRQRRIAAVLKATLEHGRGGVRRAQSALREPGSPRPNTVEDILAELRSLGSEKNRQGMGRFGINIDNAFGVSVQTLRQMAKRIGTDHELALALWAAENHEARLLACFVDEPGLVSDEQMEAWAADFDSWDLCDQATTSLFDRTDHAWKKAAAWAERDDEWVKRAGFALMAGLAVHDKSSENAAFLRLLPVIERGAFDERNFVKKAVNWGLRNIGKRNRVLNEAAIACAERIRSEANTRAGGERGGDPKTRSARWVAVDALRELGTERIQGRLKD